MKKIRGFYMRVFISLLFIGLLSACGGGGGGGSPSYVAPTITGTSYNGNQQTIAYSNGTTATNVAVSSSVTWASDHITKTTTHTFSNGGSNPEVTIVQPTLGTPTYNGSTQIIPTSYADGYNSTITNQATSSSVTWAADHITKTTTHRFANGGTNPVVTSVQPIVGTPTYSTNTQTIVTAYGDGFTSTATNIATSAPVTWASDHITKTTTYTFANGGTNPVITTVQPTVGAPIYSGNTQTIVTTYGDGYATTTNNSAVASSITWASDHITKNTTYTFANGGTNPVVTTVQPTVGAPTYSTNTQTIVTTYGDGFTSTATNTASSAPVTWASDHITKTTTYTFANGGTNPVVTTVQPTAGVPTYSTNTQTIVTTYGDGFTSTATNTATSAPVTWASDHITKTTTYTFANGGTNPVVTTVQPTIGTTYSTNTQTIVTTYGDGFTSTATNTATSAPVTWGSDHITKTTTYTFANGGTNPVVTTVAGTTNTPSLTASIYPSNWTTTGTVTPPSVSFKGTTYGDGYVSYMERGTSLLPFNQSTLASLSITDPSAIVNSTTTTYDLTWGTPDKNGPAYANLFPNIYSQIPVLTFMGVNITNSALNNGPMLVKPSEDVLTAWSKGWTGKGSNILFMDSYNSISACVDGTVNSCHGIHTMLNANLVSPAAGFIGLDSNLNFNSQNGSTGAFLTSPVDVKVINMSIGFTTCNNGCGGTPNPTTFANLTAATAATNANWVNFLNSSNANNISNAKNAVVVKSAGNAFQDAKYDTTTVALINNGNIAPRLLIVGALDRNGSTTTSGAYLDYIIGSGINSIYTNYAGSNASISSRFVLANGRDSYGNGVNAVAFNGVTSQIGQGTSYAAPVVAGYAAVVMQKFPNLDAIKTTSIILDTARYDTLVCHPSCDPAIYGKGEASLSRALAPVGYLR
jgi:Subtilase family